MRLGRQAVGAPAIDAQYLISMQHEKGSLLHASVACFWHAPSAHRCNWHRMAAAGHPLQRWAVLWDPHHRQQAGRGELLLLLHGAGPCLMWDAAPAIEPYRTPCSPFIWAHLGSLTPAGGGCAGGGCGRLRGPPPGV